MRDEYRVLPHRSIKPSGRPDQPYTHDCGMDLSEDDVKDANWCPYCVKTINKAAEARGKAEWSSAPAGGRHMKTTDLKPRELAIVKAAATATMANIRAGLVYDVVKCAWVAPEDLTIKPNQSPK